ncbi:MAG TPA: Gfo/Idh/MocA family oxidoreductase [Verrucomicrobiae bacterium]|nr:Gfo/Idh/MocA family oxidoreductase [Verrucomicrobiae bacterium]
MARTLNVGMIGYKFMGRAHSNAWLKADKFFDLKARPVMKVICGRDKAGVAGTAYRWGWEKFETDWREVVNDSTIDIVDITTPNDTHAEIAVAAAKAGKAILCEKPLALDVKQAKAMVDAVRKAGVVHMVCHNYRRIPAIVLAKKMIDAGDLGTIYHYRARYAQDWIVDPNFPLVWRLQSKIAGSGTHGDICAHIIDLGRYLIGEFTEVCGQMETFVKERPLVGEPNKKGKVTVDDAVMFIGRFANGALANLEATRFALGRKNGIQIEINGSKGSVVFDFEDMNWLKYYNDADPTDRRGFRDILVTQGGGAHPYVGNWWPPGHIIGYEHTFVHTFADFVNAVVDRRSVQPTFEDGLANQIVLTSVEKSAHARRWIKLGK